MITTASFVSISGRVLTFDSPPGVYPVNQYQSLVLATMSEIAALLLAARSGASLGGLSAWEPCCGAGPVAVTLKALGLGRVQASDISQRAVSVCEANAARNAVTLDRCGVANLLSDDRTERFDLICCNPPCGLESMARSTASSSIRQAIDGGVDGMDLTVDLVEGSRRRLSDRGSLVLIVVSTGNVRRLKESLDACFPRQWRVLSPTPVAAPWRRTDDPNVADLSEREVFQPFVWRRADGWIWRLSWVIEATASADADPGRASLTRFPVRPFGFPIDTDPALRQQIADAQDDDLWLKD